MKQIAKGEITLTTVNDAYTVTLSPSCLILRAAFDGTVYDSEFTNARFELHVNRGGEWVAFNKAIRAFPGGIGYDVTHSTDKKTLYVDITAIPNKMESGWVQVKVTTDDAAAFSEFVKLPISIQRESTMLDWIQDWEGTKTKVGDTYVMTPKLFVGHKANYVDYSDTGSDPKDSIAEVPSLTGVFIGPDSTDSVGLYGYQNGNEIFHLNNNGGVIGGWNISNNSIYSGNLSILSSGAIQAKQNDTVYWSISEDGEASFAQGNIKFHSNGNADIKGNLTVDMLTYKCPLTFSATSGGAFVHLGFQHWDGILPELEKGEARQITVIHPLYYTDSLTLSAFNTNVFFHFIDEGVTHVTYKSVTIAPGYAATLYGLGDAANRTRWLVLPITPFTIESSVAYE